MIKHIIAFKGENNSVTLSFINKFNKINNEAMKKKSNLVDPCLRRKMQTCEGYPEIGIYQLEKKE